MTSARRSMPVLLLALALAATACGTGDGADGAAGGSSGAPDAVETTHRALAAAVVAHVGEEASAAAPLSRRERVPADALGVEVAFPVEEGDSTHVRVVVTPGVDAWDEVVCDAPLVRRFKTGCEEQAVDGVDTVLAWEAGYPEEDPGIITADARHDGWLVDVYASGPFVKRDLGDLRGFADDLVALAADPAVGPATSRAYAEAGDDIDDDVWLDWYGQGNGYPPPKGITESATG